MIKEIEIAVLPKFLHDYEFQKLEASKKLKIPTEEISAVQVIKRSVDARMRIPHYKFQLLVYINESPVNLFQPISFKEVNSNKSAIIVGMGPAGMFAALKLIELGIKPIIFERGKDVQQRRRDLKQIQQFGNVNENSNYCFGEGGAGTYSDGKLYTRATKRGDIKRILTILVQHGASNDILVDSHPHIGSNKLPKVVQSIRETILKCGGEVHFNSLVTDIIINDGKVKGVIVNNNKEYFSNSVILSTGHSARDIFYLLKRKNILIEKKPFAVGVRIEHPQKLIDEIQYHSKERDPNLPASSYNLSCQIDDKGVYSFCMCPGGIIIPASTSNEELVLNGMSVSKRNSPYANAGFVVTVDEKDWESKKEFGVFAGVEFQKEIEKIMFEYGGKNQKAPAQRVTDFVKNKLSQSLPQTSYIPGNISAPLHELLPIQIVKSLKKSLFVFDKKMKGYFTEEAQILAPETRTSSPIRITRDKDSLMHLQIKGLFPCGEGAGYAGGIVSAAIDGERIASAVKKFLEVS
ncbi:MAG: FAD-binding protein [Melioribacteraceae bacterium]|nr:FAD-binding protein [Melioribacteraceae bacterium]